MLTQPTRPPQPSDHYRYVLLGLCVLTTISVWGVRFITGILLDPLSTERGWTYGQTTLAATIFMLVSGLLVPAAGWLVDRFGARLPMTAGVFLVGVGFLAAAYAIELWQLYLSLGVITAIGFCLAGSSATVSLISRWFDRQRGFALGINNAGIQMAQVVWGPLISVLVLSSGLKLTLLTVGGVLMLMLTPLIYLTVRSAPPDAADPVAGPTAGPAAATAAATDRARPAVRSGYWFARRPTFWLLVTSLATCGFSMGMICTHLPGMFLRAGGGPFWVAASLPLTGIAGVAGQMLSGWLSDRWGQAQVLTFLYGYRAAATTVIILFPGLGVLIAFAIGFGLLGSGTFSATSNACSRFFGRDNVGKTFGLAYMAHQMGGVLGTWIGGWAVDTSGGYAAALVAAALVSAVGSALSALILRQRPQLQAAPDAAPRGA